MPVDVKQFELERIINMLKSFGWDFVSSRFDGDVIHVEFKKTVKPEVPK